MKGRHLFLISFLVVLTVGILTYCSKTGALNTNQFGKNNTTGKFYSIRGFQMYCEVYGKGKPVLFIHGNGGNIHAFKKQIPYFIQQNYKVIVADSRAQGKSLDPSDSLSYEQMADDFAALLTELHVAAANVVGWSDGGIIGLLLAIRHPEKVRKLIISGANLRPDSSAIESVFLNGMIREYGQLQHERKEPGTISKLDPTDYKLLRLMVEQLPISHADLASIRSSTLVIAGDHDIIKPAHTLEIFQHIPGSYLWILPGSGHSTLIDYADEFNKKVDAFIHSSFKK